MNRDRVALFRAVGLGALLTCPTPRALGTPRELEVGLAGHAFDHLGAIGNQAAAAAASGSTIIYSGTLGALGYQGLPQPEALLKEREADQAYFRDARRQGIRLIIGYVCATSIVGLQQFDKNWTAEQRALFRTSPSHWLQQDRQGRPLPSWYGGQYNPACMNNPDWRAYEHFILRQQLEAGCDGIFFDNPTVHPQGCYCPFCMQKLREFVQQRRSAGRPGPQHGPVRGGVESTDALVAAAARDVPRSAHASRVAPARELEPPPVASYIDDDPPLPESSSALADYADKHPGLFMEFRCTIARDFLADMAVYARTIKRRALITANNSLNSPNAFYSQCRTYAYNINEMSRSEDFVVVEDMATQPRTLASGATIEYGPTYKLLHAISRSKPVVAVTVAEADYHTPPHLVRLAMAEAAANGSSYLAWPTWPEDQRARMISLIRPQADLLRRNANLLNEAAARQDAVLFLPFRKWQETAECKASALASALSRANIQFGVIDEQDFQVERLAKTQALAGKDAGAPGKGRGGACPALLAASAADFADDQRAVVAQFSAAGGTVITAEADGWLARLQQAISKPSVVVHGPPSVRAVLRDQKHRTILHLLNLNVQRLSSVEDRVTPAEHLNLTVRVPRKIHSVRALTADAEATSGLLAFQGTLEGKGTIVEVAIPRLEIASMLVFE